MDQAELIVNLYKVEKLKVAEIQKQLNVSKNEIKNAFEKLGFSTKTIKDLYNVNHDYFEEINSFDKAYWLGFFYADGCVCYDKSCLELKDKDHVVKFQEAIQSEGYSIHTRIDKRFDPPCVTYSLQVKSPKMVSDLKKWRCVSQKSLKIDSFPDIDFSLYSHFIRGYFDGDGCLSYVKTENHYRIDFVGQEKFLQRIQSFFGNSSKITKCGKANAYRFGCGGQFMCEHYLDLIYQDSTESTRLTRKYELYKQLKQSCQEKRRHLNNGY